VETGWIIDWGASQHLSRERTQFITYRKVSGEQAITIADATKINAHGIGDIEIATTAGVIRLTEVWHVPTIETSLMSVARMVDAGYAVGFESTRCYISKAGRKIDIGSRKGSLYHLTQDEKIPSFEPSSRAQANLGLGTNQSPEAMLETWHRRICHRTLDNHNVQYISDKVTDMRVKKDRDDTSKVCPVCALGCQHKEAQTKEREKPPELLRVVHSDLCGPMQTTSINGERYFITFTDEMSGRVSIYLLPTKDRALAAFQAYRARAEKSSGKEIKALRTDAGGEYLNQQFLQYLKEDRIRHIVSPPYSPAQNGLSERMNHTIMEGARCLLEDAKISKEFWGHAVLTAAHIHNRLPSTSQRGISPIEHWTGKAPSIRHLRIWGSTTWVHIPKERRRKLDPKSVKGILVGYEEDAGTKVYRVYDPESKRLVLSGDVIIDEVRKPIEETIAERQKTGIQWESELPLEKHTSQERSPDRFHPLESITPPPAILEDPTVNDILESITVRPRLVTEAIRRDMETARNREEAQVRETELEPRRSQRNRGPPEIFRQQANVALIAKVVEPEPQSLTEALSSDAKAEWRHAWESELASLAKNNTWVVEPLPKDRTAIGCRWLFQRNQDGGYKARLVAKGYRQRQGIDYEETFAPVAKFTTIRLLLALTCESNWEVCGMDVKTAFLNSELPETVYMELPEGVTIPAETSRSPGYRQPMACRLVKSIYGLKQSPRAWYGRIHQFFLSNGFSRSDADHSLFIHYDRQVILLPYVDDLVLAAPTLTQIDWIRTKLNQEFEMTDLGEIQSFLGLEIERNWSCRTLFISQTQYIHRILHDHGMRDCNSVNSPADPHIRLEKSSPTFEATDTERRRYQSAVGSLM